MKKILFLIILLTILSTHSVLARGYSGGSYHSSYSGGYHSSYSSGRSYSSGSGYRSNYHSSGRSYTSSKGYTAGKSATFKPSVKTTSRPTVVVHNHVYGSYGGYRDYYGFGYFHPYYWSMFGWHPFGWWNPWYGYAWYNPITWWGPCSFHWWLPVTWMCPSQPVQQQGNTTQPTQ